MLTWEYSKITRERERATYNICYNCEPSCRIEQSCCDYIAKENRDVNAAKENSGPQYFTWYFFFRENEIMNYLYIMGWTNYRFEWLWILIFCFFFWITYLLLAFRPGFVFVWVIYLCYLIFILVIFFKRIRIMFEGHDYFWSNSMSTIFL